MDNLKDNTTGKRKISTIQMTTDAMLAAMCALLGYFAIDIVNFKLTFESIPVLLAALLFGPVDGTCVGLIGTFLYQLLRYGVEASTPLWVIPYGIIGLVCGLYAKKWSYNNSDKQIKFIVGSMEMLIFILNTIALYFYAGMIGRVGSEFVLSSIIPRVVVAVAKAIGFGFLMPPILFALHKYKRFRQK